MAKSIKLKNDNYWDSSSIVHEQENLSTLLSNISTSVDDNYLKFANGIAICWGNSSFSTSKGGVGFYETAITFPVPFKDANSYSISFTQTNAWDTGKIATLGKSWSNGKTAVVFSNSPNWEFSYIAIGKWK